MNNMSFTANPLRTASWLFGLSVILVVIAILLLITVGRTVVQVRSEAAELDTVNAFLVNNDEDVDVAESSVTIDEMLEIAGEIQAAEERAVGYLGVFEAIAFVTSVLGLLVVGLGVLAAFVGVSNYASLLNQLEETNARLQESQAIMDTLQTGREHIKQEISSEIQKEWRSAHLALSLLPLADRQYRAGNVIGALETYERAAALDASNPVSFYYVGYIRTQRNDLQEAETALQTALDLDSQFYHAMAAIGYTYRRIGETLDDPAEKQSYFRKAESYLKQALAADDRLVDADGESWYGSLAGLYRRLNRPVDAFYYYEQAAKVTPLSSYPVVNLALMALKEGRSDVNERFETVQQLAKRKIDAELEAYWGYADLLLSELALGADKATNTVDYFLEILPPSVNDVVPRVMDAIQALLTAPPYENDNRNLATLQVVLERLQQYQSNAVTRA